MDLRFRNFFTQYFDKTVTNTLYLTLWFPCFSGSHIQGIHNMLPNTQIRAVSRADVDRIGEWLGDNQISSKWFGHYGCGEPIHRGYDPSHMLESGDSEWHQVFDNPNRMIFSLYNDEANGTHNNLQCMGLLNSYQE